MGMIKMLPNNKPFKQCTVSMLVVGRDYLTYEREPISGVLRNFVMRFAGSTVNMDEFRKAVFIFEIPTEAELGLTAYDNLPVLQPLADKDFADTIYMAENGIPPARVVKFVSPSQLIVNEQYVFYFRDGSVRFVLYLDEKDIASMLLDVLAVLHLPASEDLEYPHVLVNEPHEAAHVGHLVDTRDGELIKDIAIVRMGGYGTSANVMQVDCTDMAVCIPDIKLKNIRNALKMRR